MTNDLQAELTRLIADVERNQEVYDKYRNIDSPTIGPALGNQSRYLTELQQRLAYFILDHRDEISITAKEPAQGVLKWVVDPNDWNAETSDTTFNIRYLIDWPENPVCYRLTIASRHDRPLILHLNADFDTESEARAAAEQWVKEREVGK